jgi:hypothetical protein
MGIVAFYYPIVTKSIGGFEIDAMDTEHYSHGNTVTDIPVEDGSIINEHVVPSADEISIKAFIGRAKFEVIEGGELPESYRDITDEDPKARIKQAYYELLRLKEDRQPIDLTTGLGTFTDMVITVFDIDRDASNGKDLPFSMNFKKVRIVKSETTTINASSKSSGSGAGDQVAGTANAGTAATEKTDPASSRMQDEWKQSVQSGMTTREEYFERWGTYP